MAGIDGQFNEVKITLLSDIARSFGINSREFETLLNNIKSFKNEGKSLNLDEAYNILELEKGADLPQLKKRYRELAKRYHPDILNANNVSEKELKEGARKFQQINEAYELVKRHLEV